MFKGIMFDKKNFPKTIRRASNLIELIETIIKDRFENKEKENGVFIGPLSVWITLSELSAIYITSLSNSTGYDVKEITDIFFENVQSQIDQNDRGRNK